MSTVDSELDIVNMATKSTIERYQPRIILSHINLAHQVVICRFSSDRELPAQARLEFQPIYQVLRIGSDQLNALVFLEVELERDWFDKR